MPGSHRHRVSVTPPPPPPRHAVLLGIDGLPVASLHAALALGLAPNLKALRDEGAYTDDARVTSPSSSFSSWASTLFGVPPEFHGINDTWRFTDSVRPATYAKQTLWPNLFVAAREQRPALSTAAYFSWPPLAKLLLPKRSLNASVLQPCGNCNECRIVEPKLVDAYAEALKAHQYELSWLYIDVIDECGHMYGTSWPGYLKLVRRVDAWVGRVLKALEASGMRSRTTILVMSDHGRLAPEGKSHGGFTTAELAVQWLLVG